MNYSIISFDHLRTEDLIIVADREAKTKTHPDGIIMSLVVRVAVKSYSSRCWIGSLYPWNRIGDRNPSTWPLTAVSLAAATSATRTFPLETRRQLPYHCCIGFRHGPANIEINLVTNLLPLMYSFRCLKPTTTFTRIRSPRLTSMMRNVSSSSSLKRPFNGDSAVDENTTDTTYNNMLHRYHMNVHPT